MPILTSALIALSTVSAATPTCAALIPDYASWSEAPDQQWDYRSPRLTLVGAEHSRDPDHPQFAKIAALFDEDAPTVIFYEGPDRGVGSDAADTIRTRGESGFLRFLAAQKGVEVRRLEPSPGDQFGALLRDFPADQVLLFFTLRETARMRDREQLSGAELDAAVNTLLGRIAALGAPIPFTDVPGLEAAAARYWPGRDWRSLPASWFSPLGDDAANGSVFTASINRADSNNRNRHFLKVIAAALAEGKRPFVVVGRNHVPMLAPALDCTLAKDAARR